MNHDLYPASVNNTLNFYYIFFTFQTTKYIF